MGNHASFDCTCCRCRTCVATVATVSAPLPVDPGATRTADRALAPDLARGGMLLLIALANVRVYIHARPLGLRIYPRELSAPEQIVAVVQLTLVDGRAYPLFAFLFGYGIWQLTSRRAAVGMPVDAVRRIVRRRGWWMVAIGFVHALLLWSGDIVGTYGLVAVLLAGVLVAGSDRTLVRIAWVGVVLGGLLGVSNGFLPPPGSARSALPSIAAEGAWLAAGLRMLEWTGLTLLIGLSVFGPIALGVWAARRGFLDDPGRHRALLRRVAALGLVVAVLGGLPLALMVVEVVPPTLGLPAAGLHALTGYAGGVGYAALFGLLALRVADRPADRPGSVTGALQACGQRSLSCYLAQSVAFGLLLPAWAVGLGAGLLLWQAALLGFGVWLVILVVAAVTARAGLRGPAEVLLRRLTYGPRPISARGAGS